MGKKCNNVGCKNLENREWRAKKNIEKKKKQTRSTSIATITKDVNEVILEVKTLQCTEIKASYVKKLFLNVFFQKFYSFRLYIKSLIHFQLIFVYVV